MSIFKKRSGRGSLTLKELAILVFLPFIILYWFARALIWVVRKFL